MRRARAIRAASLQRSAHAQPGGLSKKGTSGGTAHSAGKASALGREEAKFGVASQRSCESEPHPTKKQVGPEQAN